MKLYVWYSEFFAEYGLGYILTVAESVEQARENVRAEFSKQFGAKTVWEQEYFKERRSIFENDIASEPDEHESLFITGSA